MIALLDDVIARPLRPHCVASAALAREAPVEVRAPGSSDRTAPSDRVDPPSAELDGSSEARSRADVRKRRLEFLGAILDGAPDPVVAIDCRGRVQYTNPACTKLLGTASAEVIGRHVSDLLEHHEPDQDTQSDVLRGHVEIRLASGDTRWISYSANRVALPDGTDAGAVAFLRDETATYRRLVSRLGLRIER